MIKRREQAKNRRKGQDKPAYAQAYMPDNDGSQGL